VGRLRLCWATRRGFGRVEKWHQVLDAWVDAMGIKDLVDKWLILDKTMHV
jgi:hypothetical protein